MKRLDFIKTVLLAIVSPAVILKEKTKQPPTDMKRGDYCDLCYEEISYMDRARMTRHSFNYTCEHHKEFHDYADLDFARKEAGLE